MALEIERRTPAEENAELLHLMREFISLAEKHLGEEVADLVGHLATKAG